MPLDRLSTLDATFLHVEDEVTPMHVGSVLLLEGPAPPYADVLALVGAKLPRVPRYRQLVRFLPLHVGLPVWVDDVHFALEYHVRHTALPAPGEEAELRHLVGRVMSQHLDRARPLWEFWMVEAVSGGRWALINKTHHALVDGVAGVELLATVLDFTPDSGLPSAAAPWSPASPPSALALASASVAESARTPWRLLSASRRNAAAASARTQAGAASVARGLSSLAGVTRPPPVSSLNGPIGPHRRYAWTSAAVDDVRRIRKSLGGSFNDVLLAAITRGFRDLLLARGESVERVVRTLVPVSVRGRDAGGLAVGDGRLANQISAMFAELPVAAEDPVERLRAVAAQMAHVKESGQAVAASALTQLAGFAPPMLLTLGARVATKAAQHNVNTVTTNVPGPQVPLYALGRKVERMYPYVPIGGQLRIGVAMFSYDGLVTFGVTGDYDTVADIDVLTGGIDAGITELLDRSP